MACKAQSSSIGETMLKYACLLFSGMVLLTSTSLGAEEVYRVQGEMTGEVTSNSAIVQTRLTAVDRNVNGDVLGAAGVARFEYAADRSFQSSQMTPWQSSRPARDYIIKAVLMGGRSWSPR